MFIGKIKNILNKAVRNLDKQVINFYFDFTVEQTKNNEYGDYYSNIAMVLSKNIKISPMIIANSILDFIEDKEKYFKKIEIVNPGFINFFISDYFYFETIKELSNFNFNNWFYRKKEKVLLEFVSANPTGPLNVVNARAGVVGDTLARLLNAVGVETDSEYYINDEGMQIENLAYSVQSRYLKLIDLKVPSGYEEYENFYLPQNWKLERLKDLYNGSYLDNLAEKIRDGFENNDFAEQIIKIYGNDIFSNGMINFLKNGFGNDLLKIISDDKERIKFLGCVCVIYNIMEQKEVLNKFRINFKNWYFQSSLNDKVYKIIQKLKINKYIYEQDGAVWFRSTAFKDDKDRVLIRQDGTPTYFAVDIAYHAYKKERGYDKLIDFLGPDHHGYIARTKAAVQALGFPPDSIEIYLIQLVTLFSGGKPLRMSKRAGEFITMNELLDDVGIDAVRWYFLVRHRDTHLDFDLDLAKLQSEENPLYYTQYAYARICSLMQTAEGEGIKLLSADTVDLSQLQHQAEKGLIKKMAQFPSLVEMAADLREPNHLPRYAVELARTFHSFYTECRVLGVPDRKLTDARLFLVSVCRQILKSTFDLMGIETPEKM